MSSENMVQDTLILSGGGAKSIAMIGALKYLEEHYILKNINKYAGSSAGSMLVLLLNLGYTSQDILDTIFTQDSSVVYDPIYKVPYNLFQHYGLCSGKKMISYLESLLLKKTFDKNITFYELYLKTNKILVITGTSLTDRDTYYFNYKTTPDMKVIDAVRISIAIPLFFTSVQYKIDNTMHTFVDGGLLNNFPIYYFDITNKLEKYILTCKELALYKNIVKTNVHNNSLNYKYNVIGIMLLDDGETRDVNDFYQAVKTLSITNFYTFVSAFIDTVLTKIETSNFSNPLTGAKNNFFERVITINIPSNVSAVDFKLHDDIKRTLIKSGYDSTSNFFNERTI